MRKLTRLAGIALLAVSPAITNAATLKLSMKRTSMDSFAWSYFTQAMSTQEALVSGNLAGYDITYTIQTHGDFVDFVFNFPDGWDWGFYNHWHTLVETSLNASPVDPGFRWEVSLDGEMNAASNPWNQVDWMNNVSVVDVNYLGSNTVGWLWAEGWNPNGNFWAYSFDYANLAWIYVYGAGYYYANGTWFWTWPGYGWVWKFDGAGAWVSLDQI